MQNLSAALQNPNSLQQAQVASTLELQEARAHIRELEAQLERTANALREKERQARHSQSGTPGGTDAKSEQWKMLDVQREKVRCASLEPLALLECSARTRSLEPSALVHSHSPFSTGRWRCGAKSQC